MKLTEKELNKFPIGTKIIYSDVEIIKIEQNAFSTWKEVHRPINHNNPTILSHLDVIEKVEIPTYTEYIPPKPILDDKEKEYLSAVIRPFRNKIANIHKTGYNKVYEFIVINIPEDSDIPFPNFDAGTMYKGMKLDREYSLDELGL